MKAKFEGDVLVIVPENSDEDRKLQIWLDSSINFRVEDFTEATQKRSQSDECPVCDCEDPLYMELTGECEKRCKAAQKSQPTIESVDSEPYDDPWDADIYWQE